MKDKPTIKPINITQEAHRAARELALEYQREKGLIRVTLQDAASLAILEALERRHALAQKPKGA